MSFVTFWIWMLFDLLINNKLKYGSKSLWLAFVILTFVIGAIIYYISEKLGKRKE